MRIGVKKMISPVCVYPPSAAAVRHGENEFHQDPDGMPPSRRPSGELFITGAKGFAGGE
jgi:hypothetical protein